MKVFKFKIKQGVVHITAGSKPAARRQRDSFERDAQRYWVRQQTEVRRGVFALGTEAMRRLGLDVYVPQRRGT